jgi:hypothetical protein
LVGFCLGRRHGVRRQTRVAISISSDLPHWWHPFSVRCGWRRPVRRSSSQLVFAAVGGSHSVAVPVEFQSALILLRSPHSEARTKKGRSVMYTTEKGRKVKWMLILVLAVLPTGHKMDCFHLSGGERHQMNASLVRVQNLYTSLPTKGVDFGGHARFARGEARGAASSPRGVAPWPRHGAPRPA